MEGLSVAASGIAVVSLTIQLVDSIREIQSFLRRVSDAPKELKRLLGLLEQLELILESIRIIVEKQRKHSPGLDVSVCASILRAVSTCRDRLVLLGDVVASVKKASSTNGKVQKSLECFRLACKKKDIEEFETLLQQAVSILDLTMTMNLTVVHFQSADNLANEIAAAAEAHTAQPVNSDIDSRKTTLISPSMEVGERCEMCPKSRGSKKLLNQSTTIRKFVGPFGKLLILRTSSFLGISVKGRRSKSGEWDNKNSTWIFMPSFFSRCIQLQCLDSFQSFGWSFRIYPIIPSLHPVWDLCVKGDLKGLQTMFSERQVSPFSVSPQGRSLLHCAALHFHSDIIKVLFELGSTGEEVNDWGHPPSMAICIRRSGNFQSMKSTYRLFAARVEKQDLPKLCPLLFAQVGPWDTLQVFSYLVDEWLTPETIDAYESSPVFFAVKAMLFSKYGSPDDWKLATQRLIRRMRPNLHKIGQSGFTILRDVLFLADDPFGSIELGDIWLDILASADVSIPEYLRREIHLNSTIFPTVGTQWRQRHINIKDGKTPRVFWDWFIDPTSPGYDVLREFENFGPAHHNQSLLYEIDRGLDPWPYVYPQWHYYEKRIESGWVRPEQEEALARTVARQKRRRYEKALKVARSQGFRKSSPIPGAWIY